MQELINVSFQGANAIPSFLLIFIVIYWIVVMIGAIDIDTFDIDLDIDADGPDVDMDTEVSIGWLNSVLAFFNLGHVPLMVFLSFLVMPLWIISVQFNQLIGNTSLLLGLVYLIPSLLVSLFIAKFLTIPFVKVFSKLNEDSETNLSLVGKVSTALMPISHIQMGQVEIDLEGSIYRISAKTFEGKVIQKGEEGLVIEYHENGDYYVVEPYEH